jgi:hypothetical protein
MRMDKKLISDHSDFQYLHLELGTSFLTNDAISINRLRVHSFACFQNVIFQKSIFWQKPEKGLALDCHLYRILPYFTHQNFSILLHATTPISTQFGIPISFLSKTNIGISTSFSHVSMAFRVEMTQKLRS